MKEISENQDVEVLISYDEEWDLVRYKNTIGFVKREFLDGIVDPNFDSNITLCGGYVTALEGVRLRAGASTEFEKTRDLVKEFINANKREEIIFTSKVVVNQVLGQINDSRMSLNKVLGAVQMLGKNLNQRTEPSVEDRPLGFLDPDKTTLPTATLLPEDKGDGREEICIRIPL